MNTNDTDYRKSEITYRGTTWILDSYWVDTGGEDGVEWLSNLEWIDADGNRHTEDSWYDEKRRSIPNVVLEWRVHMTIQHCPAHAVDRRLMRCPICRIGLDEIAYACGPCAS